MTYVHAYLRSLRIAPRKVRQVANLIKGMEVDSAHVQLRHLSKHSAEPIAKLLKSAVANARHNAKISASTPLFVHQVRVDEGRVLKRSMPRARGSASQIKKRTSHISLVLETRDQK